MIYGSVCSGIEAATLAWHPLGWRPAFFSEIENAPRAVLRHHYPDVPLHGDFTTIRENEYGPIDILAGGTPCQDFSVAGLRKGLAGDRGNLTIEFLRLIERLRPRWVVWENVPGVLSIDGGRAFGAFGGGLAQRGYGFAYRVLDAQYYGVPQRRRRVILIGYLGDWRPPAAVLFESESLRGDSPPSRKEGQEITGTFNARTDGGGGFGTDFECLGGLVPDIAPTLDVRSGRGGSNNFATSGGLIPQTVGSLCADTHPGSYSGQDAYTGRIIPISFDCKAGGNTGFSIGDQPGTLRGDGSGGGHAAIAYDLHQITSKINRSNPKAGDPCHSLHAQSAPAIALDLRNALRDPEKLDEVNRQSSGIGDDIAHTISASINHGVASQSAVRRLTPRECERLQGIPDDYTLVPINADYDRKRKKKIRKMSDSARYRMIRNSWAVPKFRKIGERIDMVEKLMREMRA